MENHRTGSVYIGEEEPNAKNWVQVFLEVPARTTSWGMIERDVLIAFLEEKLGPMKKES